MTSSYHEARVERAPGRRASPAISWSAVSLALCLALGAAGCGGSKRPGVAGSGSPSHIEAPTASSGTGMAQLLAYAGCMRSHGVSDFPDPTSSPGGGAALQINGGPGSDLDRNNPTFKAASRACQSLLPGGGKQPPAASPERIAAEVSWAQCVRTHGLPGFPDPDSDGAFDSGKFDPGSAAFQAASKACLALQPPGPTAVVPGRG